jgi:hypothetical protein
MEYDDKADGDQVYDERDASGGANGGTSNSTMPTLMEHTAEESNEHDVGTEVRYNNSK